MMTRKRTRAALEDSKSPLEPSPPKKKTRARLVRTETLELEEEASVESTKRLLRKTSSYLEGYEGIKACLSTEDQESLTKALSIVIEPSMSIQQIDLSEYDTEIRPKENQRSPLPGNLWVKIFAFLHDEDRATAASTCSFWNALIKEYLGFDTYIIHQCLGMRCTNEVILEDFSSTDFHLTLLSATHFNRTHHPWMFGDFLGHLAVRGRLESARVLQVESPSKEKVRIPLNSHSVNGKMFPEEFLRNWFRFERSGPKRSYEYAGLLPDEEGRINDEPNLSATIRVYKDNTADFTVSLQSRAFLQALGEGKTRDTERAALAISVLYSNKKILENLDWVSTRGANFPDLPATQPTGFKDIKLYGYQLNALAWMKKLESNTNKVYSFSKLVKVPGLPIFVDMKNLDRANDSVAVYDRDDGSKKASFRIKGGILADEMGLGKTITMISLLLANPLASKIRPKGTGTIFHTKATLVVCATQLVAQWAKEIQSKTKLKVLKLSTLTNVKKATYKDIFDHDVIIAPYSLLTANKKYNACYSLPLPAEDEVSPATKMPNLQHFWYHRIIADEAHEINDKTIDIWEGFQSTYRWYVSGTPFPQQGASFLRAVRFLGLEFLDVDFKHTTNVNRVLLWKAIQKIGFWRQTKSDVIVQTDIPPLTENIQYLEFSPIENALYEAAGLEKASAAKSQREVCSNPRSSMHIPPQFKEMSLSKLAKPLVSHYTNEVMYRVNNISHQKERVAASQILLDDERKRKRNNNRKSQELLRIEREHTANQRRLKTLSGELIKNSCLVSLFSRTLPSSTDDPCHICSNVIMHPSTTPCHHTFCYPCIALRAGESGNCPTCGTEIQTAYRRDSRLDDVPAEDPDPIVLAPPANIMDQMVHSSSDSEEFDREGDGSVRKAVAPADVDGAIQKLLDSHGTKMHAVVEYLYDVVRSKDEVRKVIVFSQYHNLLSSLHTLLLEVSLETFNNQIVMCKGNIHVRTKKLKSFNSSEKNSPRILMLSLLNSASGSQLEAASHIILLDPVVGTREEAHSIDAQAIARAHRLGQDKPVEAVRFIAAMTIEQTDYENAYGRRSRAKSARK